MDTQNDTTAPTMTTTLRGAAKVAWLGCQARTHAARSAWEAARAAAATTRAVLAAARPGEYGPAMVAWAEAASELARARASYVLCPVGHRGSVSVDVASAWDPVQGVTTWAQTPPQAVVRTDFDRWLEGEGLRHLLPTELPKDPAALARLLAEAGI